MATDECDCMNVCYKNIKNKQKEWHYATKYLKKKKNIFGVKLCFLYFNCLLYYRHAYQCYTHIHHSEGFFEGAKPFLFHLGSKL
jgi:hypothetical protein